MSERTWSSYGVLMKHVKHLALVAALTAGSRGPAIAANPARAFTLVERGTGFDRLDDAVKALGTTGGTISVAPGRYRDCAVIGATQVTVRALQPGTAIFDGGACEGKATLVLRGRAATIDGLVFQNIRVPDGNGAGIRLEAGDLNVVRTTFRNSEQGILTGAGEGTVTIERSTFSGLGGCDAPGGCSHSIYIGGYSKLIVSHCRFERGTGGHYVKSRARVNDVTDSSFDDSGGRATNYMIDLPAGSTGLIARNAFVQGKDKDNQSALIAVAAENRDNPSQGLRITDNAASLAPGARGTTFVADWSHAPLAIGRNALGPDIRPFETR